MHKTHTPTQVKQMSSRAVRTTCRSPHSRSNQDHTRKTRVTMAVIDYGRIPTHSRISYSHDPRLPPYPNTTDKNKSLLWEQPLHLHLHPCHRPGFLPLPLPRRLCHPLTPPSPQGIHQQHQYHNPHPTNTTFESAPSSLTVPSPHKTKSCTNAQLTSSPSSTPRSPTDSWPNSRG